LSARRDASASGSDVRFAEIKSSGEDHTNTNKDQLLGAKITPAVDPGLAVRSAAHKNPDHRRYEGAAKVDFDSRRSGRRRRRRP